jgi:hypothetical protein
MVAKKTATKSAPKRKPVARKTPAKKQKVQQMKSFRIYKNEANFTEFRLTRQTLYWTILLGFIVITQLWILKVQLEIAEITNSIIVQ